MGELLVILDGEHAADARDLIRKDHRVTQQASFRVIVVDGGPADEAALAALPGVVAVTSGDPPGEATSGLADDEALFVRAWVTRLRAKVTQQRRGEGATWDAPGFEPPDPRTRRIP